MNLLPDMLAWMSDPSVSFLAEGSVVDGALRGGLIGAVIGGVVGAIAYAVKKGTSKGPDDKR